MRQGLLTTLIVIIALLLGVVAALVTKLRSIPTQTGPRVTGPTGMPIDSGSSNESAAPSLGSPPATFRVAAIQTASTFGEPEANRKRLQELIETAARAGAQVIVLPEAAIPGYLPPDLRTTWQIDGFPITEGLTGRDPRGVAETVPGDSTRFFGLLASRLNVYLTVPIIEVDRKSNRLFNSVVLMGPNGSILRHYRKKNPWPWAERGWTTPGDLGNPVVDTPFGRLGMLVCFDIHEQAKILAEQKVDTLLYLIAWVDDDKSDWFTSRLPAIAQRYNFNVVGANWSVPEGFAPTWHGYGQSLILNKFGNTVAKAEQDTGDEIVIADLPCDR